MQVQYVNADAQPTNMHTHTDFSNQHRSNIVIDDTWVAERRLCSGICITNHRAAVVWP